MRRLRKVSNDRIDGFSAEVVAVATEDATTFTQLKCSGEAGLCLASLREVLPGQGSAEAA